jgi:hypothetical protein
MPSKPRAATVAAPEEERLVASIDRLTTALLGIETVLEEIRVDFQHLCNNGLAVRPIEHIVVHKMGLDPYAPEFSDHVEVTRYSFPGDIAASPLDSDTLDRVVDDLKRTFEAVAQGQLEVVLTALDGVRREVVAALKRTREPESLPAAEQAPLIARPAAVAESLKPSAPRPPPGRLF